MIAPRKLDERCTRVKTDPRDATTLCQRLSRYLEGNTRELAVIRVPSEEEEQARHLSRQREQLVHHRQKLEAQGRALLVSHALPAPAHWWKQQTWTRLQKHLPEWIVARLEGYRPALFALQDQISQLGSALEAAAPKSIPVGLGKLTTVVLSREICDWRRFHNRRTISSYTGLCPGERSSGSKRVPGKRDQTRQPAGARRLWSSAPGAWCASSRNIRRWRNGSVFCAKARAPPARCARKRSWPWPGTSRSTSGASIPAASPRRPRPQDLKP